MNKRHMTLQKTLATAILSIGVIGILLVVATDYTYRQLAYEQQKESVGQLIKIKSADLINKLTERQKDLGFKLLSESGFLQAVNERDTRDITYWLNQEFNRYYVTIGLVKLEKIIVFDNELDHLASSSQGIDIINKEMLPCASSITHVSSLPTIQRTRTYSRLCQYNDRPLLSTVLSIGSIKPQGYVQILSLIHI